MEADCFRNRQQRFSYLVAKENARRIKQDPTLLAEGRRHLDARLPEFAAGADLWRRLLDEGADAVAAALVERSATGDYVRETAPSFGGLPARTRAALLARAATPLERTQ